MTEPNLNVTPKIGDAVIVIHRLREAIATLQHSPSNTPLPAVDTAINKADQFVSSLGVNVPSSDVTKDGERTLDVKECSHTEWDFAGCKVVCADCGLAVNASVPDALIQPEPKYVIPAGVEQLVNKLETYINPVPELHTKEWFDWQSLPLTSFYGGMQVVRERLGPGRHKFLDVGSGLGTKLYLADTLGFEPWGIEHNLQYVDLCYHLWPEFVVHECNALEFEDYNKFDVIYSFRCARDSALQDKLNEHILKHMRDDAIFFLTDTEDATSKAVSIDGVQGLNL